MPLQRTKFVTSALLTVITLGVCGAVVYAKTTDKTAIHANGQKTASAPTADPSKGIGTLAVTGQKPVTTEDMTATTPDFIDAQNGFLGANQQVFATQDGGSTWQKIGQFDSDIADVSFINANEGFVILKSGKTPKANATTETNTWSIEKTTDRGKSWQTVWTKTETDPTDTTTDNVKLSLFAQTGFALIGGHVLASNDGGNTWRTLSITGRATDIHFVDANTGWIVTSTPQAANTTNEPQDPESVVRLLKTTDGGQQFTTSIQTAPIHVWQAEVAFGNANQGIFLVKDLDDWNTTMYLTNDGGTTWSKTTPNQFTGRVGQGEPVVTNTGYAMVPQNPGAAPFAGGMDVVNLATGQVTPASRQNEWRDASISQRFGNTLYATASLNSGGAAVLKSTDGGHVWRQIYPETLPSTAIDFVNQTVGYGIGTVANQDVILKTSDGGQSWSKVANLGQNAKPLAVSFQDALDGEIVVQGQNKQNGEATWGIEVTHDGGKTWAVEKNTTFPSSMQTDISRGEVQPTYLYATSSGYVLGVTEGAKVDLLQSKNGLSWRLSSSVNTPNALNQSLAFADKNDGWLAVSSQPKAGSEQFTTSLLSFNSQSGKFTTQWKLPQGWLVEGIAHPTPNTGILFAQKHPWDSDASAAVFITTNAGKSWRKDTQKDGGLFMPLITPLSDTAVSMSFVDDHDGYMLLGDGILKTTDGGTDWHWLS
ncbi:hypothetical protein [Alicyclobacillus fodiniaquatilis]|uniref:Photosynthesis system II assembly factor Ycf48/Hcf136-like domain-containing protein n=1 Tax=Alicyclobacillus fodiniaquatilis TaxID=1661150 RepID=A0ABW4JI44_9BACL